VFFKCENMQRMGAFKFRGGYNSLAKFTPEQRKAGVVAFSSGNHAQAIALSAKLLGIPATIVMPHDAPAAKVAATKGYGAQVVIYDRYKEDREQIGRDLAASTADADSAVRSRGRDCRAGHGGQGVVGRSGAAGLCVCTAGRWRPAGGTALSTRAVAGGDDLRRGAGGGQRWPAVIPQR
jgi:threonine dehydratase